MLLPENGNMQVKAAEYLAVHMVSVCVCEGGGVVDGFNFKFLEIAS